MKNKNLAIFSASLVMVIASISCFGRTRPVRPLIFEPEALPAAQLGASYETEVRISQNDTPVFSFLISKGALPEGLEFVKVEGQSAARISGIPEEKGSFTFTIEVKCYGTSVNGQQGEMEYTILVEE